MAENIGDISYESLGEGYYVCVSQEHRFGTDAFLLADFASPRRKDRVCDLCTGGGIVALLLSRNFHPEKIYAVELQKKAYEHPGGVIRFAPFPSGHTSFFSHWVPSL